MEVFKPANAAQLKDALAWSAAEGQTLAVRGLGTKTGLGRPVAAARVLDTLRSRAASITSPRNWC